jgi:hypothetical protein
MQIINALKNPQWRYCGFLIYKGATQMKVRKTSLLIFIILMTSLLTGCFTKSDLREPIGNELKKRFGITEFEILSTTNNWFEGIDHDTVIEIKKPYFTRSQFFVSRQDYSLYGVRLLEDILKGAFVVQFPKVIEQSNRIIRKYKLMSEPPMFEHDKTESYHYYLQLNFDDQQKADIEKQLKSKQKVDLLSLLPTLRRVPVGDGDGDNTHWQGVVNFIYYYNVADPKMAKNVPQAADLARELQESGTLPPSIYNVKIRTIFFDETSISFDGGGPDSNSVFQID